MWIRNYIKNDYCLINVIFKFVDFLILCRNQHFKEFFQYIYIYITVNNYKIMFSVISLFWFLVAFFLSSKNLKEYLAKY